MALLQEGLPPSARFCLFSSLGPVKAQLFLKRFGNVNGLEPCFKC